MKKLLFIILITFISLNYSIAENKIISISEGSKDAKVKIIVYESLTCGHCAEFHKTIYPEIKKDFIDTGLANIEFRNFPLNMAALNASKIAHCKNDGDSDILHFLYKNQRKWVKGDTIDEANKNLKNLMANENFNIDFESCIKNKLVEDYILEDRIKGVKKFEINATPTLVIDNKKLKDPFNYKKIKKTLEKLI
jgi:protein-disulfide isomerase